MTDANRLRRMNSLYTQTRWVQTPVKKDAVTKVITDDHYWLGWGSHGVQYANIEKTTGDVLVYRDSGGVMHTGSAISATHETQIDARITQLEADHTSGDS